MDVKEYIRRQIEGAWRSCDGATSDLTDELLNWTPPGKTNTISATLAHILGGEDTFIQAILQGKPRIWETQNWAEKIGVSATPRPGTHWEEYRGKQLSIDAFRAYQEAVRAGTRAFLETLSTADLDRQVNFAGRQQPAGETLVHLVVHILEHTGEIAALKGIQGARGLPM